jgi:large subunit ribosomal protein L10
MPPRPGLSAIRRYATVAADAVIGSSSEAAPARIFTDRKAFLYSYYTHLLRRSEVVLLFQHANLSVSESNALRSAIAAIPVPAPASPEAEAEAKAEAARLTIARTGLLAPVVRAVQPEGAKLSAHLEGQTALITCPSLSPKYVSSILAAIDRVMKKAKKDEDPKSKTPVKQPAFTLTAGVLEGNRLLTPEAVREVAKLPELDVLRAQLVGLLETPGRQLVGVLTQAGGGALVRTLQGLEQGLKDQEEGKAE